MNQELERNPTLWEIDRGLQEAIFDLDAAEEQYAFLGALPAADVDSELFDSAKEHIETMQLALRAYIEGAIRKVDGVVSFLRFADSQRELAKAEKKRVAAIEDRWERRIEVLETACVSVLRTIGEKRMESASNVIRRQKNPPSALVVVPSQIPSQYVRVTVQMTEEEWKNTCATLADEHDYIIKAEVKQREFMLASIRDAMKRDESVPGAVLDTEREHLRYE